ncbi:MAG: hypothetical protein HQL65_13235 [Magnetococcales bacterium]|nr:hypothetical protein [Magnetococcales bacterium]
MGVSLNFIWKYYEESSESLRTREKYGLAVNDPKNILLHNRIKYFFVCAQEELEELVKLDFLSEAEGRIKDDFKIRVSNYPAENPAFVVLFNRFNNKFDKVPYSSKAGNPCIIETWKSIVNKNGIVFIDNYEKSLELRHWLAHGRNWNLSPTSRFAVKDVKRIVENVLSVMNISIL